MAIHRGGALIVLGLVVLSTIAAIIVSTLPAPPPTDRQLLDAARQAQDRGDFSTALDHAVELIDRNGPDEIRALKLAGRLQIKLGDYDAAVFYLAQLADSHQPERITGMLGPGDHMDEMRALTRLETSLQQNVQSEPLHVMANDHLAFIMTVCGRRWEARAPLRRLLQRGRFTMRHLLLLGEFENVLVDPELLEKCRELYPDDPLVTLGRGFLALSERDFEKALTRFNEARVASQSVLAEAEVQALLLELDLRGLSWYVTRREMMALQSMEHPGRWLADAEWALRSGQDTASARCLWEAIHREPDLRDANYRLAQLLNRLNRPEDARPFRERSFRLEQLENTLGLIEVRLGQAAGWDTSGLLRKAARQCEGLGRMWEALGWASEAVADDPGSVRARDLLAHSKRQFAMQVPPGKTSPTLQVDLSGLPLPDFGQPVGAGERPGPGAVVAAGRPVPGVVAFEDLAVAAGIDFTYFNSANPATEGALMFEFTGGGVAVLDFDRDGWPDLYFTQGCRWPPESANSRYHDRLYRNNGDGTFADVTDRAGLGDRGFSQGATVGDLDNDGWPDLYVANIGPNRLYHNNGDGTFSDVSIVSGLGTDRPGLFEWTTSCLLADLNGDGHADLYDVNYLTGRGVFSTICQSYGVKMACHPNEFDGRQDRLWLGDGTGRFLDATEESGIQARLGKGLGIVAADFLHNGSLELFVANDAVPNFLFVPTADPDGPLFKESAMVRGVAVDRNGRAQACMGVAAGDADGDGRIDLFVTNFYNQANAFYRQAKQGHFSDTTRTAGLREPGWRMLGFGTQFLDADLDGHPDLVVANGHVDDLSKLDQAYRMRPQFFRNAGDGSFVELQSSTLGKYFQRELLGRGLARVDFDRDGREDFVVSHLEQPVSLLANRTSETGGWLAVRLVATATARDAIGARVTLQAGEWTRTHQLTAGDGYLASNQRQLVFGLGERETLETLVVSWPSGQRSEWRNIRAGQEIVVVEGRSEVYRLP